jgi:hypothetical protein
MDRSEHRALSAEDEAPAQTLTGRWYAQPVSKQRDKHPFEDNPFAEGLLDWMGSPEGQLSIEVSDTLWELMENVQLDARRRELIWPEAERLSLEQSAERIQNEYPHFPRERIESFLISWLEHYAPEGYSQQQLDELDQLTEQWIYDYERRSKSAQKPARTRDS